MQALWKLALDPVAETLADPNSYGFRPERSTTDAIEQCFNTLAKRASPEWVLEGDIRGCFDNFSHLWLLEHVTMDKKVLQRWLQAGYIDEETLCETSAGTPQGGIISPVIANMALDGLEAAVYASVGSSKLARSKAQLNVVRYADDFVVTGASKDVLEFKVLPAVRQFLAVRGLELSEEKTRISNIAEGFDFLGQNVRKYDGKLLIKPARKSVKALLDKVREITKGNTSARGVDTETEPGHSGMGHVSPSRRGESELLIDRLAHLATALEMGKSASSHERSTVGEKQILPDRRTPILGFCEGFGRRQHQWAPALSRNDDLNYEARQGPGNG